MSTLKPNRLSKIESVFEEAGLTLPQTIETAEAGLIHIAILNSVPDMEKLGFNHTLKIVKTHKESFSVLEKELAKETGKVFILHDGNEWTATQKDAVQGKATEAKDDAKPNSKELESERKKNEDLEAKNKALESDKEENLKYLEQLEKDGEAKDKELAELRAKLAEKKETPAEDAKEPDAGVKTETKKTGAQAGAKK